MRPSDADVSAAQSIAEFKIRSVMCVPLATQDGKPLGVIQLDSQDRTKKFSQDDLKFLICVAAPGVHRAGERQPARRRS